MIERLSPPTGLREKLYLKEASVQGYDCQRVEIDFREPMLLPFGLVDSRPSVWANLELNIEGSVYHGYGEGVTLHEALFTDDSGHNIEQNVHELAGHLMAQGQRSFGEMTDIIKSYNFKDGGQYPTARLALEVAILDSYARSQQTSIRDALGIAPDIKEVAYGKSIGASTKTAILEQTGRALDYNASKIKLKISPEAFDEVVAALHEISVLHSYVDLMVDANGTFDPTNEQNLQMLQTLDSMNLVLIEEPVSRRGDIKGLDAVRLLRQQLPQLQTRICLDDCLRTYEDCVAVIDGGLAEAVNIKPGRIGSFMESLKVVDLAKAHNAFVMVGGMFEATPGRCVTTILAAYAMEQGCSIPGDISLAQERLAEDLVSSDKQLRLSANGNILIPEGIGWGY